LAHSGRTSPVDYPLSAKSFGSRRKLTAVMVMANTSSARSRPRSFSCRSVPCCLPSPKMDSISLRTIWLKILIRTIAKIRAFTSRISTNC